jgi:hypothetical protein
MTPEEMLASVTADLAHFIAHDDGSFATRFQIASLRHQVEWLKERVEEPAKVLYSDVIPHALTEDEMRQADADIRECLEAFPFTPRPNT